MNRYRSTFISPPRRVAGATAAGAVIAVLAGLAFAAPASADGPPEAPVVIDASVGTEATAEGTSEPGDDRDGSTAVANDEPATEEAAEPHPDAAGSAEPAEQEPEQVQEPEQEPAQNASPAEAAGEVDAAPPTGQDAPDAPAESAAAAPAVNIGHPGGTFNSTQRFAVTASGEDGPVDITVEIAKDGEPWRSQSGDGRVDVEVADHGRYTVEAWVEGAPESERAVVEIVIDRIGPQLSITSPADRFDVVYGSTVRLEYTCSDDFSAVTYCANAYPSGMLLPTTTLGFNRLYLTARDSAGNLSTNEFVWWVVPAGPRLTVQVPPATDPWLGWHDREVQLHAAIRRPDATGDRIHYRTTGALQTEGESTGDVLDLTIDANGVTTVYFAMVGEDGVLGAEESHRIAIDTAAPEVEVAAPVDGATLDVGEEVLLEHACSDAESGIRSCEVSGDVSGDRVDTSAAGEGELVVTATDRVGLVTSRTVRFQVVEQAPGPVTPVDPAPGGGADGGGQPTPVPDVRDDRVPLPRAAGDGELARTGADPVGPLAAAVVLLLIGALGTTVRPRRRKV